MFEGFRAAWVSDPSAVPDDPIIGRALTDYAASVRLIGRGVNTSAIVSRALDLIDVQIPRLGAVSAELLSRLSGWCVSASTILGLLGTFLGLSISIYSLNQALVSVGASLPGTGGANSITGMVSALGQDSLDTIIAALRRPLAGMGTAFTTSLVGVSVALCLTLSSVFRDTRRSRRSLGLELESFLDNQYYGYLVGATLEGSMAAFGQKLDRCADEMSTLVGDVRGLVATSLQAGLSFERLAEPLQQFTESVKETMGAFVRASVGIAGAVNAQAGGLERLGLAVATIGSETHRLAQEAQSAYALFSEKLEQTARRTQEDYTQTLAAFAARIREFDARQHELASLIQNLTQQLLVFGTSLKDRVEEAFVAGAAQSSERLSGTFKGLTQYAVELHAKVNDQAGQQWRLTEQEHRAFLSSLTSIVESFTRLEADYLAEIGRLGASLGHRVARATGR